MILMTTFLPKVLEERTSSTNLVKFDVVKSFNAMPDRKIDYFRCICRR